MKVVIYFRRNNETERQASDYAENYRRATGFNIQLEDVDTRAAQQAISVYELMQYPAMVVKSSADDRVLNTWQGTMPLINELQYYTTL
jgi:hypothetical protein